MIALMLLVSCGDEGDATPGRPALLRIEVEPEGENCEHGGQALLAGTDDNGSGKLEDAEIDSRAYLCNGADGVAGPKGDDGAQGPEGPAGSDGNDGDDGQNGSDGATALVRVDDEPPGANCADGGKAVRVGVDTDRDGDLDDAEISGTTYLCDGKPTVGFKLLSRLTGPGGPIAEIVAASHDGNTIAFTNGGTGGVELLDISNPTAPVVLGTVDLRDVVTHAGAGEPTSIAFTPNGAYVMVVVKDTSDPIGRADPGELVFIDPANVAGGVVASVPVGVGPDSLKVTHDGTRALIAIEDEEDVDRAGTEQARPGSVQVVTLDFAAPAASTVTTVALSPDVGNAPRDPQPEYIDVSADSSTAIVSLQENNAVAVIDLTASPPAVVRYIDMGLSIHSLADVSEDGQIAFTNANFSGRREPDAVCLLSDGERFVTANEGDTSLGDFVPGQRSGGRGFSVFKTSGELVYDSGSSLELLAVRHGQYQDTRSADRGIEVEGCATGRFGAREYAFFLGERNSSLSIYDVTEAGPPRFVQMLPAPFRPEGVAVIPRRNLVIVAGEGANDLGGGLWIYQGVSDSSEVGALSGSVLRGYSPASIAVPFGAISGAAQLGDPGRVAVIADSALSRQRLWIFEANPAAHRMDLTGEISLADAAGVALTGYDPEGLTVNPEGGFIVATEGTNRNGGSAAGACSGTATRRNRVLFFTSEGRLDARYGGGDGIVDLPCLATGEPNGIDWTRVSSNGFEGVAAVDTDSAASPAGLKVYVAFQRPLEGAGPELSGNLARIGEYDVSADRWSFYFYPLEPDLTGAANRIFLSEIVHLGGTRFAVIERDQRRTGEAVIKRIYSFNLTSGTAGDAADPLEKTLAVDLLAQPFRFDFEKIEGLATTDDGAWVINDNDGGDEATLFMKLGPL